MPKSLEFGKKQHLGRFPHSFPKEEEPVSVSDTKGLYLQASRMFRKQDDYVNWSQMVQVAVIGGAPSVNVSSGVEGITIVAWDAPRVQAPSEWKLRFVSSDLTFGPVPIEVEKTAGDIDPAVVVEYFSTGGAKSVVKFWAKLKRELPSRMLPAVRRAFAEALSPEQRARVQRAGAGSESFVTRAQRLDSLRYTDAALDLLYDAVDELMRNGEFVKLDSILASVPVADLSIDVLLGLLTATFPAHSRLPSRAKLFRDIEHTLKERGEYEDGLLAGLEG